MVTCSYHWVQIENAVGFGYETRDEGSLTGTWLGLRTGLFLGNTWAESIWSFDHWPEKNNWGMFVCKCQRITLPGERNDGRGHRAVLLCICVPAPCKLLLGLRSVPKMGGLGRKGPHSPYDASAKFQRWYCPRGLGDLEWKHIQQRAFGVWQHLT